MRTARIAAPLPEGRGVSHRKTAALVVALAVSVSYLAGASHTSPAAQAAASKALNWLKAQQRGDGSVGDLGQTAELVLAIAATGSDPNSWNPSPVSFLQSKAGAAIAAGPGVTGKVILAVKAARKDPRAFGGRNLVSALKDMSVAGKWGTFFPEHAFAMMGLAAANEPLGADAAIHVVAAQNPDGGWGLTGLPVDPFLSDTNDTALALQALGALASPPAVLPGVAILRGHAYLRATQSSDAGWPYQPAGAFCSGLCPSDPNSTAYVVQSLTATSAEPDTWTQGTRTPVQALIAMQNSDGSFKTCDGCSALFATLQAVPGLFAKPLVSIAAG